MALKVLQLSYLKQVGRYVIGKRIAIKVGLGYDKEYTLHLRKKIHYISPCNLTQRKLTLREFTNACLQNFTIIIT